MLYAAPMARAYLASNPNAIAYSWPDGLYVFRWNTDHFECKDLKTDSTWRYAGGGCLLFVEKENFLIREATTG